MAHFYFQARQNNTRIQLVSVGSPSITPSLECSTDESNWSIWYNDSTLSSGQTLYLRGDNPDGYSEDDAHNYWHFKIDSGSVNIGGDIRSLVDVTMASSIVPVSYCFSTLFDNCTRIYECTDSLLSGFTTLTSYCYSHMFQGCSNLITAPVLPAMIATDHCYHYMFAGCTSLTTAPELPATTVEYACYAVMFNGCTNLTIAPSVLPASIVTNYAYSGMFGNCTSLITAPQINATTLGDWSCRDMFADCSGLTYIKCLATTLNGGSTSNWVKNVSPTGTFVKNAAMNDWTTGVSGIPEGWTVIDDATASITPSDTQYTGLPYESVTTQRPTVTYVNINVSTVSAVCPADWVELDWVDSSKTQLEIDIDDNDGAARTATITISGNDMTGGTQTATIYLQQVEKPHGAIAVNPTTVHATIEDMDYFVEVSYTGFTSIGTVTATTTADWIDLEWRDDEIKSVLKVIVSQNSGTPRQSTITITGTDDYDNVITVTFTVIQEGLILNPIWKDEYYTGATSTFDYMIINEDNDETIYQGRVYVQPNETNVKLNISKIVQNYLSNEIPDGNALLNASYDNFNSQAIIDFGLYPIVDGELGDRIQKYTYFYDWSYKDFNGNDVLTTPINGHATTTMRRMYTNMSLEFDGYRNRANDSTLYDLSYCGDYALYYLQRNGGWASFLIEGNSKKTDNYERYTYSKVFDNRTAEFEENTYNNQITSEWEMHTKWLTETQAKNLAFNLLASNRVFIHDLNADKIIPAVITNSSAEYKTFHNNGNKLINYTITLRESQKKTIL